MIQKIPICRDDQYYLAWPDVALTQSGKLVCVFSECTHHGNRDYTRIMSCESLDRGRTWSTRRPVTAALNKAEGGRYWNCARITALADGRLAVVVDRVSGGDEGGAPGGAQENLLLFSEDDGRTWGEPLGTPVKGIVPDKIIELAHGPHRGRWILAAHTKLGPQKTWTEHCWASDDQGIHWRGPFIIGAVADLMLCEGSVMELHDGTLACFMRENSGRGLDAFKSLSHDGGTTWEGPIPFPLPGCHRPVAGMLQDGRVLITHRFMQGGKGWTGWWTQNLFAGLTDVTSCLAAKRGEAHTRILPVDFDRSPSSDTGYSGWVQFPDGELFVVNYIVDDWPRGQIRGYVLGMGEFLLPG